MYIDITQTRAVFRYIFFQIPAGEKFRTRVGRESDGADLHLGYSTVCTVHTVHRLHQVWAKGRACVKHI